MSRKLFLTALIAIILSSNACDKNLNPTAPIENPLLGRWKIEGGKNHFTFLPDGTFYYKYTFETPEGVYSVKGDTLIMEGDSPDYWVNGTGKYIFKVADDWLLLTYISEGIASGPTYYKKE